MDQRNGGGGETQRDGGGENYRANEGGDGGRGGAAQKVAGEVHSCGCLSTTCLCSTENVVCGGRIWKSINFSPSLGGGSSSTHRLILHPTTPTPHANFFHQLEQPLVPPYLFPQTQCSHGKYKPGSAEDVPSSLLPPPENSLPRPLDTPKMTQAGTMRPRLSPRGLLIPMVAAIPQYCN